jgi:hypothetical protein
MGPMPGSADCPHVADYRAFDGVQMWVGYESYEGYLLYSGVFRLQSTPLFRDWTIAAPSGIIQVADCNIVPCATYTVQAVSNAACDLFDPATYSTSLVLTTTSIWGDIVGNGRTPADGTVDAIDVAAMVDRFKSLPGAPPRTWCDLNDNQPTQGVNFNIDALDITRVVDAFKGRDYPFSGPSAPAPCPGTP